MNKENSIPGPTILWSEIKDQKVKSVDGKDMGKIKVISQNHFMVEKGLTKKTKFWIPKFLADVYDGQCLWLNIEKKDIIDAFYYDEEPEILRHQTDVSTFNTKYGINKTADSYEKIPIAKNKYSSVTQQRGSKQHYKNIRDLK